MPLDPSISLGVKMPQVTAPDPTQTLLTVAQLKNAMATEELRRIDAQKVGLETQILGQQMHDVQGAHAYLQGNPTSAGDAPPSGAPMVAHENPAGASVAVPRGDGLAASTAGVAGEAPAAPVMREPLVSPGLDLARYARERAEKYNYIETHFPYAKDTVKGMIETDKFVFEMPKLQLEHDKAALQTIRDTLASIDRVPESERPEAYTHMVGTLQVLLPPRYTARIPPTYANGGKVWAQAESAAAVTQLQATEMRIKNVEAEAKAMEARTGEQRAAQENIVIQPGTSPAGMPMTYRIPKVGGVVEPLSTQPGAPGAPGEPVHPVLTPDQLKAIGFLDRAKEAHETATRLEAEGHGTPGLWEQLMGTQPLGNPTLEAKRQVYNQAKRQFLTAFSEEQTQRGINPIPLNLLERQFFPVIGESSTLNLGRARELAINQIALGAGQGKIFDRPAPLGTPGVESRPGVPGPPPAGQARYRAFVQGQEVAQVDAISPEHAQQTLRASFPGRQFQLVPVGREPAGAQVWTRAQFENFMAHPTVAGTQRTPAEARQFLRSKGIEVQP